MPAQQELSQHVEEIADALDERVDNDEIEEELGKYLEYNVPLEQAKREIVRNHGGTLETGPRALADLQPDDSNVDLRARVLTVNPKEVEVDGEPKEIWSGFLADESDRVPYTAWQDFDLEPGASIAVENAYVKEGYQGDGIEVNLGDYAEVRPAEGEVDVGDHDLEGDPEGVLRLADLDPADGSVDLEVRILTVNPKEVEVDGEPQDIWYGFMADETARVPYTAWEDLDLEPGTDVAVDDAYVKEGYGEDEVEVSLGEYTDVGSLDEEVDVGDHGLEGGDPSGPRALESLEPGQGSVDLEVRILTVNPKEVEVDGEPQDIWYGFMADETARVPYTAWQDHGLEQDGSVVVRNAYVKEGYQGDGVEVNLGDYAEVEPADGEVEVEGAHADEPTDLAVRDLEAGQRNVGVEARILDLADRTVTVEGEETHIREGVLADETGKARFTVWDEDLDLEEGAAVEVANATVRTFRGLPNLSIGEDSTVEELPESSLPPAEALAQAEAFTVAQLEERGGGTGVAVEGVILQIQDGSGLVFRCPECNRVLQSRECREHGDVDGDPDLRVKAVLDDGTGAVTTIFHRDLTEDVMGTDLEEYQEVARDAMTHEVVRDEIEEELTATWMRLEGDVSRDDFGLTFYAEAAETTDPGDIEAQAESVLYELEEALP
jgi:replication factor A1